MKKSTIPLLALPAGIVGALLQLWAVGWGFDPVTHLALPGTPSIVASCLFAAASALGAMALARWGGPVPVRNSKALFALQGRGGALLGGIAGALVAIGGALLAVSHGQVWLLARQREELFALAVGVLLAAAGVCLLLLSTGERHLSLAALIPGFAVCFWLILFYHTNSRDPEIFHYLFRLLALMSCAVALYYQACLAFDRPRPKRALGSTLIAGVFCLQALPTAGAAEALALLGLGLWMLQRLTLLAAPEPPVREPDARELNPSE